MTPTPPPDTDTAADTGPGLEGNPTQDLDREREPGLGLEHDPATNRTSHPEPTGSAIYDRDDIPAVAPQAGETEEAGPAGNPLGIRLLVGQAHGGVNADDVFYEPSNTSLNQLNMGVVGDLGTGKTQFLKSMVYQFTQSANANRGHAPKVFIFDYKRDYSEGDFPSAIGAKVWTRQRNRYPSISSL